MQENEAIKPKKKRDDSKRTRNVCLNLRSTKEERERLNAIKKELGLCLTDTLVYLMNVYEETTNHGNSRQ